MKKYLKMKEDEWKILFMIRPSEINQNVLEIAYCILSDNLLRVKNDFQRKINRLITRKQKE